MMRNLILELRRVRGWITMRWRFAGMVTLGVVAVAATLLIEGYVVLGFTVLTLGAAATWLTGIWVVPGGIDAYYRKVTRLLRDSYVQSLCHNGTQIERLRSLTHNVAVLVSSTDGDARYKDILAECEQIDGVLNGEHMGHDQIYHQVAAHRRQLLELEKKLKRGQADSLDVHLTAILGERALVMTGIPSSARRLLENQHQQLVRIKSPAAVRVQHRHYVRILEEYISALAELDRAMANEGGENEIDDMSAIADVRRHQWRSSAEAYAGELRLQWVDPKRINGQASITG
jgi:hypothetical protein